MSKKIFGLPERVKIELSNSVSFKVDLHAAFHRNQYNLLRDTPPELLKLPEVLMRRWEERIGMESRAPSSRTRSFFTQSMREKDRERRRLLTYFFTMIRAYCYRTEPEVREAALKIAARIRRFRGMQNGGSKEVLSGQIASLEMNLKELTDELEVLGMTNTVKQLHDVTTEYTELSMQRVSQRVENRQPTMLETRRLADEDYALACQYVEAAYLYAKSDEVREEIVILVNRMNRVVWEFKKTYHEMLGQRRRYKQNGAEEEPEPEPLSEEEV